MAAWKRPQCNKKSQDISKVGYIFKDLIIKKRRAK